MYVCIGFFTDSFGVEKRGFPLVWLKREVSLLFAVKLFDVQLSKGISTCAFFGQ